MKQELENKLVERCLSNYDGNLAAALIFGSYNTGPFIEGVSDLDVVILLKTDEGVDFKRESEDLTKSLKDLNVVIHHFRTIDDYKAHIYDKGSWSSWITVICGGKIAYTTSEFEKFRKELAEKPIEKERLREYFERKDKADLFFDLEERSEWGRTKAVFSHIRRKLQILNYYNGNKLDFDYMGCLERLEDLKDAQKLEELGKSYENRKGISLDETKKYIIIARELTKTAVERINQ